MEADIFDNNLNIQHINECDESTIGIFNYLDYDLSVDERRAKFMKCDFILCETCYQKIHEQHYKCENCYNKTTDDRERNHMNYGICKVCFKSNVASGLCPSAIFRTSDYNLD